MVDCPMKRSGSRPRVKKFFDKRRKNVEPVRVTVLGAMLLRYKKLQTNKDIRNGN